MTRLSVNLNKVALIRNARGGNLPNLLQVALDCEKFGAEGITVHPRPDQRHVRYDDIGPLKQTIQTELNIEGNPTTDFIELVLEHRPAQCTLVPDAPEALTSDAGWNTLTNKDFLISVCNLLKAAGIRVSLFVDPVAEMIQGAKECGTDCVEFYTGPFSKNFSTDPEEAVKNHVQAALLARSLGLKINAGHDLNLDNLSFYAQKVPHLDEVSIGHALISDALYLGLEETIKRYKAALK
ncbi:MAG: pyridoxine 5'-phosphate synthase [Saprospiraceae bacterium]|nr:pyridoxine 5'-phosphate synthase [Saprospiraceae bacterium]